MGVALAGLSSDGRVLCNFMKTQCLSSRFQYGRALAISSITDRIGSKAQENTQHYGKRPYGVGLLVAGVDAQGPHLFEFMPSGMTQEMSACAIGGRSQMARTYLERHMGGFEGASREELIAHGLKALKESLSQEKELSVENTSVAVVGWDEESGRTEPLKLYDGPDVGPLLEAVDGEAGGEGGAQADGMEVDS